MKPGPDETIIFDGHPSWRSVLEVYAKGDLLAIVVGAILWIAISPGVGAPIAIFIFIGTAGVGSLKRRGTRYMVTNERLYIRRGILSKQEQQTRLERVQDVSTRQSFFERILGIGTVDFDTAGNDDDDFRFTGVDDPGEVVRAVDAAQKALGR